MRGKVLVYVFLLMLFGLTGCNVFAKSADPSQSAVKTEAALGDTFEDVNKVYGSPTRTNLEMQAGIGEYVYQNDKYLINFAEGKAISIVVQFESREKQISEQAALEMVGKMIPKDATLVSKSDQDEMERIYLYHSNTIDTLFDPVQFMDRSGSSHPGQVNILMLHYEGLVSSITLEVGPGF